MRRLTGIRWWIRWWARYFPVLAIRRLTCKHEVRHDCMYCLNCGAPWFKEME